MADGVVGERAGVKDGGLSGGSICASGSVCGDMDAGDVGPLDAGGSRLGGIEGDNEGEAAVEMENYHEDVSWFGCQVDKVRKWFHRTFRSQATKGRSELDTVCIRINASREMSSKERKNYPDNSVCTSKYSWYNFLPMATALQFRRFSNAFYLIIVIINSIGYFCPNLYTVSYAPWGTLAILIFVIMVTLIFEGKDDMERHIADKVTNNKPTRVVMETDGKFEPRKWGSLRPGDVVRIDKGELVPADVLLVRSSAENGKCYIETSGIDGETNLKLRSVPVEFCNINLTGGTVKGSVYCEEPNPYLQFSGKVCLDDGKHSTIGVDFKSIILRGSQLRNTAWVEAIVLYSGSDTKLILSSSETPSKFSRLDTTVNRMMGYLLVLYIIMVVLSDVLLCTWIPSTTTLWYFQGLDAVNSYKLPGWLAYLFTFLGTFASIVPINMYVCLEIVNFVQGRYINWDLNMYDPQTDTPAKCRTGSLVAEIGQITHVFSDKTGTLTNNEMRLVSLSTGESTYGFSAPSLKNEEVTDDEVQVQVDRNEQINPPRIPVKEMFRDLLEDCTKNPKVDLLLTALAICHTVVIDFDLDGKIQYNAEGPDEEALVTAAAELGVRLTATDGSKYTIETRDGTSTEVEVLGVNKFSSDRKRMSVVVRNTSTEEYFLFIKGADNVIYELPRDQPIAPDAQERLDDDLQAFSLCGLRTLLIGFRKLNEKDVNCWMDSFEKATKEIGNQRSIALDAAASFIERNIEILGVTGIEDALQEGVPEAIKMIRDGGIKLWVLTGDKIQTAINIALSAQIMDSTMTRILLDEHDPDLLKFQVKRILVGLAEVQQDLLEDEEGENTQGIDPEHLLGQTYHTREEDVQLLKKVVGPELAAHMDELVAENLVLVISGRSLKVLLEAEQGTKETQRMLLELSQKCSVVMACRVSPKQKALIVRMVETQPGLKFAKRPVTLAIGDGANDVAMIQEARVGVGISGKEGLQAVNSSDFSIAKFRFLRDLLFVHGRLNYLRNTVLTKYISYSWLVLGLLLFMYVFYSMVSGQQIMVNTYYITLYAWVTNSVITAIAWFQRDIGRETIFSFPSVYATGRENQYMNGLAICKMFFRAFVHAGIIIAFAFYTLPVTISLDGLGAIMYTAIFLVMYARQAVVAITIPLFLFACFIVCFGLFIGGVAFIDTFLGPGTILIFAAPTADLAWSRAFLATMTVVVLEYAVLGTQRIFFPNFIRTVREYDRYPKRHVLEYDKREEISRTCLAEQKNVRKSLGLLMRRASERIPSMQPVRQHKGYTE